VPPIKPQSDRPSPAQRVDETHFGRLQQLREYGEVRAAGGADPQRCIHVKGYDLPARRQPQLALAGEQHVLRLMLLPADQGVLVVGAEPPVGSGFVSGAGKAVVAPGPVVPEPSARLVVCHR
jgi:hypothetical protein